MVNIRRRAFDWAYLLIMPAVLLTYFVPIRMRVGNMMIVPFVLMWLVWMILRGVPTSYVLTRKFLSFFIPLSLFFLLRSISSGWGTYSGVPLIRLILYSGITLFYVYLFHYTVSRGKYKELLILNLIILFCLVYGSFSSLKYDIGESRMLGRGIENETWEKAVDRLEHAASGATNYGDAYAMVFISIALIVYLMRMPLRFKFVYLTFVVIFCMGVYRASFSTGLAILMFMGLLGSIGGVNSHFLRACRRILPFVSITFVTIVAFPQVLSPFSGLVREFGVVMEPIARDYAYRLSSIADAMAGYKDTYAVNRAQLYWNSLDIFIHNPIFGYRWDEIIFGVKHNFSFLGHSYFFDALAASGAFIGLFLVVAFVNYLNYLKYIYKYSGLQIGLLEGWYYAFWAFLIVGAINQIDSFAIFIAFFFVVPSIPFYNYRYHIRCNQIQFCRSLYNN